MIIIWTERNDILKRTHYNYLFSWSKLELYSKLLSRLWSSRMKLRVPQRCKTFIWLVAQEWVLTNASRVDRRIGKCRVPSLQERGWGSDLIHVLRDCDHTRSLWKDIIHPKELRKFMSIWSLLSGLDKILWGISRMKTIHGRTGSLWLVGGYLEGTFLSLKIR